MIKAAKLAKSFGLIKAVDNVSLHVQEQDIFGLVGPDGAGKTTLMRMLCGLISPDQGQLFIRGVSLKNLEQAKSNLGYMPQRFSLYGDLTVMENIYFFGSMYKVDKATILMRADEILTITGLINFKNRFADNLSGGMKQKLALTCALVNRPGLLVLDEPTYGVDPESRKEFWKILYALNRKGMTIMVSTPYMDEAELCKLVAFMDQGKIKAIDSPAGLKKSFKYKVLELRANVKEAEIMQLPGVLDASLYGNNLHVLTDDADEARESIGCFLSNRGFVNIQLNEIPPSMEEVFVALAEKEVAQWIT